MIKYLLSLSIDRDNRVRTSQRLNNSLRFEWLEARCVLSGDLPLNLEDWQSAIFDNGVSGTLPFVFSRDTESIDSQGGLVGVDEPRYGDETMLSEAGSWSEQLSNLGTNTQLFSSGWDHDGETPLAILWSVTTRKLTFVRGYDFEVVNEILLPQNLDLFNNTITGYRYLPQYGIIHEGLCVLMLRRDRREGAGWVNEGISFAYTQDLGASFQRVEQVGGGYDVPAIAGGVTDGIDRARSWSFANAFPEKSADDVLGAWFPWADYLQKSGYPKGGQIGVFRARRAAVGDPWVVEANVTVYETWRTDDSGGFHAHSAGMFTDGLVSFWGDVGYRNRMVRHIAADLENYTTTTWIHEEEFQGGWSPSNAPVYALGNQATSAAPGPVFGEVLVVGDEQAELIMKVQRPENMGEKAIISNLRGSFPGVYAGSGFAGRTSLSLQHLRGVGYVATELSVNVAGTQGVYYSADGEHWAELVDFGGNKYFFGNKIIAISGSGLFSLDVPTSRSQAAPLLLNPGGQNLATSDPVMTGAIAAGNTARRVIYVDGVYKYMDTLEPLDVQPPGPPPVMDGMPMWEFTATGTNRNMGAWELGDIMSQSDQLHWLTAWHYSLDGNGIAPSIRVGDISNTERQSLWVANSEWVPSQNFGLPNPNSSELNEQRFRMMNGINGAPRRWLTAIEGYVQGNAPTYPLGSGEYGSNELASVLLNDTTASWSTALTFGLSQLSSFSTHFDPVGTGTIHTLASIYESDSEHVDITFSRTTSALGVISVDVYHGGLMVDQLKFENIYLDREDQMRMVISNSSEEFGVTLLVTRQNYDVESDSIEGALSGFVPNQIRLSNATQTRVEPLEWYAIQFSPTQALSTAEREEMIRLSLMFEPLDTSSVGGADFDGNGAIDGRDFLIWQRGFGMTENVQHENGDANDDGRVDGLDLTVWKETYEATLLLTPPDADFNHDAVVDSNDLAIWQENYGSAGLQSQGDADNNGDIDGRDFLLWQRQVDDTQAVEAVESISTKSELSAPADTDFVTEPATAISEKIEPTPQAAPSVHLQGKQLAVGFWLSITSPDTDYAEDVLIEDHQYQELVLLKKYSVASAVIRGDEQADDMQLLSDISEVTEAVCDWSLNADLAIDNWLPL